MAPPRQKHGWTPPRRRVLWLYGALVLVAAPLLGWFWQRRQGDTVTVSDPRLTTATPYRNVRPEVRYVGDAACAECHRSYAESYHHHSMGRSLAPVRHLAANQRYDAAVHNPFETEGFRYQILRQEDRVFHQETVADAQGRVVAEQRVEIDFVIGSGSRAYSYLFQRDGFLFQSPITWYAQKEIWDLSPGYRGRRAGFQRGIVQECLFCHCNHADRVENTVNQYRKPIFQGLAIGCERCHGPGELHVERRRREEPFVGLDDTIVNPADLDVPAREAVCQQCHLQGAVRVPRRGLDVFAFRPGLPLHLFWSVFVRPPEFADHQLVGQVEQMAASRCFRASPASRKLGCISCHDPHVLPTAEQRVAHYRASCLQCHQEQSCTLAADRRRQKVSDDSCIACHMPRLATSDIVHTAVTDHRIVRQAQLPARPLPKRVLRPGEAPLVYFHRDWNDPSDPEVQRDLGLALVDLAREASPVRKQLSQTAAPLLEAALQRQPNDVAAWEAQGQALWVQQRSVEALASCERALTLAPGRETALADAATYAQTLGKRSTAIAYCQRLLAINPWASSRRFQLAQLWADSKEWDKAAAECREVLRINPAHLNAHLLLAAYYLEKKDRSHAQAEFEIVLALHPRNPEAIRRWYREKTRGG
ncbi:MAG: tetratricopeptide repeat protein [Gemmataceae bacterium]